MQCIQYDFIMLSGLQKLVPNLKKVKQKITLMKGKLSTYMYVLITYVYIALLVKLVGLLSTSFVATLVGTTAVCVSFKQHEGSLAMQLFLDRRTVVKS